MMQQLMNINNRMREYGSRFLRGLSWLYNEAVLQRENTEQIRVIDFRCRLISGTGGDYFADRTDSANPAAARGAQGERAFFRMLDDAGIRCAVSVSGQNPGMKLDKHVLPARECSNDEMADVQKRYPGRFMGVAGIDASDEMHNSLKELERSSGMGLKAAFIEPGRAPLYVPNLADRRLYPVYELARDLDMTLIPQTSGLYGGKNIDYAHPRWIDQVSEDFPDLRIVCGHGCYPYFRELIVVCRRRSNIWMSPDIYMFAAGGNEVRDAVNRGEIADSFIFGSAYPAYPDLKKFFRAFMNLGWKKDVVEKILYRNALRAMSVENDDVFLENFFSSGTGQ